MSAAEPADHGTPDPSQSDASVYAELVDHAGLGAESGHWAFGTSFEDPLAGVDTTLPEALDGAEVRADLAAYCLMLGDDALVLSHRLSQWCSNAPDLEEDIALANIALDLLGQARLLLARAAAADPSVVPTLPPGSPVPAEDALAFFRDAGEFRNLRLVEAERGDFGETVARLVVFSVLRLAVFEQLRGSRDHVLAAVAAKGVKELAYHRDYAARWFLTLARGTEESRRRLLAGLEAVWPTYAESWAPHPVEQRLAAVGIGVDPASVRGAAEAVLDEVLAVSEVERPDLAPMAAVAGRRGRDGLHTEALSRMLGEMQSVARAHPEGRW